MNLLKISTCALCLGTVLGVSSSMAMEQNGEKCQQNVSKQVQNLETNRKSKKYLRFYNDLITKGKLKEEDARKQAEIFDRELKSRKSSIYAQYYSMLRVVRRLDPEKAMLQAEVFEREFKKEKNFRKADYYATIMILRNLKAVRFAKLEEKIRSCEKSKKAIERVLKIVKKEVELGRSYFYASEYAYLLERGELIARKGAEMLERELMNGRSIDYAKAYSSLILFIQQPEEEARKWAEVFETELINGKSIGYAGTYVSLRLNNQSEENARKSAEILELEKKSLESCGKFQDLYAQFYLMARTEWDQPKEIAGKAAHVIIEELKSGRSQLYAKTYAKLVVINQEKEAIARKKLNVILEEIEDEVEYE